MLFVHAARVVCCLALLRRALDSRAHYHVEVLRQSGLRHHGRI